MAKWLTRYAKGGDKVKDKKSTKPPIYITHDPNDPRIQARNDSNYLHAHLQADYNKSSIANYNANTIPYDKFASKLNPFSKTKTYSKEEAEKIYNDYYRQHVNNNSLTLHNIGSHLKGNSLNYYIDGTPSEPVPSRKYGGWLDQYQDGGLTPNQLAQLRQGAQQYQNTQSDYVDGVYNPSARTVRQLASITPEQMQLMEMQKRQNESKIGPAQPRRSAWGKAGAIARNPMTAAQYVVQGQPIPDYFEKGDRNIYDYATDVLNPMTYVDAGKRTATLEHLRNMKSLQDLPGAALNTALDIAALTGLASEFKARPNVLPVDGPTAYTSGELKKPMSSEQQDKAINNWLDNYRNSKSIPEAGYSTYTVPEHLDDAFHSLVQSHTNAGLFADRNGINRFLSEGNFKTPSDAITAYSQTPQGQRLESAAITALGNPNLLRNPWRNLDVTAGERADVIPKSDYEWYNDFTLPPTNQNIAAYLRDNRSVGLGAWNNRPDLRSIFENASNEQSALSDRFSNIRHNIRNTIPPGAEREEAERLSGIQHGKEYETISARLANQIEQAPNMRFRPAPSESPAATGLEYYNNRNFQNLRSMGDLYRGEYDRILRTPTTPQYKFRTPPVPDKPIEDILNEVGVSKEDADAFKTHLNKPKSAPGMLDYSGGLKEDIHISDKSILENTDDIPKQIKTYEDIKSKLNPDDRNHAKVIAQLNRNLSDLYSTNWLRNGFQYELAKEGKVPTKKNLSIHTMGSGTKYLIDEDGKVLGNISGIDPSRPRVGTAALLEEHHSAVDPNNNMSDALYRGINQGLMKAYNTNLETAKNFAYTEHFNPTTGEVERLQRAKNYWESRMKPRKGLNDLPAAEPTDYGNIKMIRGLAPFVGVGIGAAAMSQQDNKKYGGAINKKWLSKY